MSGQSKNVRVKRKLEKLFYRLDHLDAALQACPADNPNRERGIRSDISALKFAVSAIAKVYPLIEVPEKYRGELH